MIQFSYFGLHANTNNISLIGNNIKLFWKTSYTSSK